MKIGAFAKKYQLPIPTIRYYIELGLLIPKKNGVQYDFNEKNEKEIETILELRQEGFTLHDMESYINTLRMYDAEDQALRDRLSPLLQDKKKALQMQISHVKKQIQRIDTKLAALKASDKSVSSEETISSVQGFHADFLSLLACPVCGEPLCLQDCVIKQNGILSGALSCACGYKGAIQNGMIFTDETVDLDDDPIFYEDYFGNPEQKESYDHAFFEILEDADSDYLTMQHKVREWMHDTAMETREKSRVILFPDVAALFLYLYHDAPYLQDALILVTGLSKKGLAPIQHHLASLDIRLKMLFIISPDCSLPIRDQSIDLMIDYLGSFSYAFYKKQYYYHSVNRYFTKDAAIIGCLDYYGEHSRSTTLINELYSMSAQPFLGLTQQKDLMKEYGYSLSREQTIGFAINPSAYFDYHVPGDQRYSYVYLAQRHEKD